ncbi:hypothetical protein ACET3X_001797 [Alternaria dauci]|uniref:C2H2-type domain-containing protein n=1 Tax=Alternaria dauci TaxID=48095 RepID=A0ABR3UZD9_9PLEO
MAHSVAANDRQEQVERRQQPIRQVVYTFLINLKLRFGEGSSEVMTILDILSRFQEGARSKKDTLVAIRLALGDQADLKQDLLNILFHREADWGVGDFDFGSHELPSQGSPSPQFLQPAHQPQMRLPPISPLWYEAGHAYPPVHPTGAVGSGNHGGFGMPVSSLLHQTASQFCHPNVFTSPVLTDSARFGPHVRDSHEGDTIHASKQCGVETVPHPGRSQYEWEETGHPKEPRSSYIQPWSPVASSSMLDYTHPFASSYCDFSALSRGTHQSPHSSSNEGQTEATSPSVLGTPIAVPIGQAIHDMPPPSNKRRRGSSRVQVDVREDINEDFTHTANPTPRPTTGINHPFFLPKPKKKITDENTTSGRRGGHYIHSLCGKGFSSRSKVKKHHWGNKLDDLETTTGCWAKKNKPSENQPSFEGLSSYHSHQLPVRTSLDKLLTAVNIASEIDAPRPQGRIDSVVSHLDAQAAATERNKQYVTEWQSASDGYGVEPFVYDQKHPYTDYELGLQGIHVPVNVALPGLNGLLSHTPSMDSLAHPRWHNDRNLVYAADPGHATLRSSFSPDSDEGHQS